MVEGKIDFDRLRATLGAAAESGPGRFSFTWAGKDDAIALLQTPSRGTIALREGYSLNTRFETMQLANGATLHIVRDPDTGQHFFVCLDDEVRMDLSRHCELTADRLLVCRDRALDDSAAANLVLQCRLKTI